MRTEQRWKVRPEGSNWGDYGRDDQIGRLNELTPERRLKAFREVAQGISFCLSLPLDLPGGNKLNPNRHPPKRGCITREPGWPNANYPWSRKDARYLDCTCDDYVELFTQYSTQWDALSHVGQMFDVEGNGEPAIVYYNGFRAGKHILGADDPEGPAAASLGIENMAQTCVQARGVMLDFRRHFGTERKDIGFRELQHVLDRDRISIETGDILCLHTGYAEAVVDMKGNPDPEFLSKAFCALDGDDAALREWIAGSGIVAIAADNNAVERVPEKTSKETAHAAMPLHELCLFKLGIHLGELWYLTELADWLDQNDRRYFLLTAPPLRLPGSFGSPVTPVATV